jgi:hypothetical protein
MHLLDPEDIGGLENSSILQYLQVTHLFRQSVVLDSFAVYLAYPKLPYPTFLIALRIHIFYFILIYLLYFSFVSYMVLAFVDFGNTQNGETTIELIAMDLVYTAILLKN